MHNNDTDDLKKAIREAVSEAIELQDEEYDGMKRAFELLAESLQRNGFFSLAQEVLL